MPPEWGAHRRGTSRSDAGETRVEIDDFPRNVIAIPPGKRDGSRRQATRAPSRSTFISDSETKVEADSARGFDVMISIGLVPVLRRGASFCGAL